MEEGVDGAHRFKHGVKSGRGGRKGDWGYG